MKQRSHAVEIMILPLALLLMAHQTAQSQEAQKIVVELELATSGATYRNTIRGRESIDYIVRADAGQELRVDFSSSHSSSYINIYAPDADAAMHIGSTAGNRFEGILPEAGDYRIQVYLMRNAARRNETADFTLEIGLTGGSGSDYADGLAGGPDFWTVAVEPGDQLNVRSGPATGHDVVARLADGTVVRNLGCTLLELGARWCRVRVLEGDGAEGWVAGRFLEEAAPPGGGGAGGTMIPGEPELFIRSSGEIEVRWKSGCTALYEGNGSLITAGSSCSDAQRRASEEAVQTYRREQNRS